LLVTEWRHRHLDVLETLSSEVRFEESRLGNFPVDAILVGGQVLCIVTALKENIGPYEPGKAQTGLRALDLPCSLVINFGKHALQIRGVRPPRQ
jgi:hypothetical protein